MQTDGQQSNFSRTGFIHLEHPSSLSYLERQLLSGEQNHTIMVSTPY
jgi:hypothetical protein